MATWEEVINDPEYTALPEDEKSEVRKRFWNNVVLRDPEVAKLNGTQLSALEENFFGIPKEQGILSKAKAFLYDRPKEGAAVLRDAAASALAPTEQEIVQTATETGDVPEFKILRNMAVRGVAELIPMTPSEIGLTVLGTKLASSGASVLRKSFPRAWSVMQRNVGKGLFAKIPPAPIPEPAPIPVPATAGPTTEAIASAPAMPGGKDVFGQQLSKFNVSDDAKGIFKETSELFKANIEEARRGVQDWDQTAKLADDLGMSVDDLVKRRGGQALNAEELEAAKGLVGRSLEDVNAARAAYLAKQSDETLVNLNRVIARHAAVQQSFLGARAEAGRALQILRKATDPAEGNLEAAIEVLGGREITKEIAQKLSTIDPTDVAAMHKFIRDSMKAKTADKIYYVWINSILSSPLTHLRNIYGNTMLTVSKPVEKAIRGGIDAAVGSFTGKRTAYASEAIPEAFGLARGITDGLRKGLYVMQTGLRPDITKVEGVKVAPIGGALGRVVGAPVDFLSATDEVFKSMIAQSEISALAVRMAKREGLKGIQLAKRAAFYEANPTEEMISSVGKETLTRTFQNINNSWAANMLRAAQKAPYLGKFVVPFVNTPVNIAGQAALRSPLGWLKVAHSIANKKGQEQIVEESAKAAMGSAVAAATAFYVASDRITGSYPKEPSERARWDRIGKRPYSVKIGDYWAPYTILDPFAANIGMIADTVQNAMKEKKDADPAMVSTILSSIPRYFVSRTFMSGLRDFLDGMADGEKYGPRLAMRLSSGMVPYSGFMRYIQNTYDQTVKDPKTIGQAMKSVIPGVGSSVPAKLDPYGDKLKYPGFDESTLQGMAGMAAIPLSRQIDDPLVDEDIELDRMTGFPSKTLAGVALKEDEYRRFVQESGQKYKMARMKLVQLDKWRGLPQDERNRALNTIQEAARKEARLSIYFDVLDRLPASEARRDLLIYGARNLGVSVEDLKRRKPK